MDFNLWRSNANRLVDDSRQNATTIRVRLHGQFGLKFSPEIQPEHSPANRNFSPGWNLPCNRPLISTIFTATRLFFSKHLWALCNTLLSIIPYMGSVWARRNKDGAKLSRKFALASHIFTSRGFRVVDVAIILHLWQTFVKKIRRFFRNIRSMDYIITLCSLAGLEIWMVKARVQSLE